MTPHEIAQIITLARRAPLANMAEAEAAAMLLQKLAAHFAPRTVSPDKEADERESAQPDR